jgi:CubicO group peptidase (beta-lactamase class C family)
MLPRNRPPTHPGEMLLEEFLKPFGMTQTELAQRRPSILASIHHKYDVLMHENDTDAGSGRGDPPRGSERGPGRDLQALVNRALRLGLREIEVLPASRERYEIPSTSLGGCRLPDLDNVSDAIALGEGEGFR